MKLATSVLVALLALAPAVALAKDSKTTTQNTPSTTSTIATTATKAMKSTKNALTGKVDINTASESDLTSLFSKYEGNKKAEQTAQAVIGGRTYGKTNELVSKKIISARLFNSVKSKLSAQ